MSDVIQVFLPVFLEKNRQECLYHGGEQTGMSVSRGRTDRNVCITGEEQTGMSVSRSLAVLL